MSAQSLDQLRFRAIEKLETSQQLWWKCTILILFKCAILLSWFSPEQLKKTLLNCNKNNSCIINMKNYISSWAQSCLDKSCMQFCFSQTFFTATEKHVYNIDVIQFMYGMFLLKISNLKLLFMDLYKWVFKYRLIKTRKLFQKKTRYV